jgi:hypothetical protein
MPPETETTLPPRAPYTSNVAFVTPVGTVHTYVPGVLNVRSSRWRWRSAPARPHRQQHRPASIPSRQQPLQARGHERGAHHRPPRTSDGAPSRRLSAGIAATLDDDVEPVRLAVRAKGLARDGEAPRRALQAQRRRWSRRSKSSPTTPTLTAPPGSRISVPAATAVNRVGSHPCTCVDAGWLSILA